MEIKKKIKQLSKEIFNDVVDYRRHIHQNPELAFEENETAAFISSKLEEFNIPYKNGIAKTGIIALLEGRNPTKRVVGLRADMDALPIHEANDVSYRSKNEGKMHACGHDVHTASLLGVAKILANLRDEFEGTVKFFFQPSEEKFPGGASVMIKEGALENPKPDVVLAQHVFTDLDAGMTGFKSGMYMASADEIYLTVKGKGGHAAMPHENIDPILIASHIIVALQQIISRNANIITPSVLSFGKLSADGATNVIPDEVRVEGTFRTFNETWRLEAHQKIKNMAEQIAKSMGGECEVNVKVGYPCLVNHENLTNDCMSEAISFLGEEHVEELPIRMTSEDFSYFSQASDVCFYRLGVRNESRGITSPVHSPSFDIDEAALETGVGLMSWLTIRLLNS